MARARATGVRMGKQWSFLGGQFTLLTVDATVIASASIDSTTAQTILRMIGEYSISPTSAPVAGDRAAVGVGIGVVSSDAFAAGSGSMPDPSAEADYPWLYWANHTFSYAGVEPSQGGAALSVRKFFDIKSMRRMKPRESLATVVQYVNLNGDPPLTFAMGVTRVLLGLH